MTTRAGLAKTGSGGRRSAWASATVGVLLTAAGAAALAGLFYIGDSRAPSAEHAMISLGLAGAVLASALAQALVIVGLWMVWRSRRRR